MRLSLVLLAVLALVIIGQSVHYYPLLPATMASHFGASGQANAWQSKGAFFGTYWGVCLLLLAVFVGLPPFLGHLPTAIINLPHKEYWLAPEHRATTLAFFQGAMGWFGVVALGFMMAVIQLVIQANLSGTGVLPPATVWPLFGAYMAFVIVWTGYVQVRFRQPR
jgi:uncharacterized membrane protein